MVETQHLKTGVIREIIKIGHAVYGHPSFRIEMDRPSCKLNRRTPRELINRGQTTTVLEMFTEAFESQRV